jgi:uncharacterized protein YkwD
VRLRVFLTLVAAAVPAVLPFHAQEIGQCLTADEAQLAALINLYRQDNALLPVPVSKSLTTVAQWHAWDLVNNNPVGGECNLHSWSDYGTLWNAVCYTSDHAQASGMWNKPSEITGGVYSAFGYEIAVSGGIVTPESALDAWKNSPGHNDVILNQGIWASRNPWPAMGVGMLDGYAVVWFGDSGDPAGTLSECGEAIFSDGFESGNTADWAVSFPP